MTFCRLTEHAIYNETLKIYNLFLYATLSQYSYDLDYYLNPDEVST